jgi:hypothetical protein
MSNLSPSIILLVLTSSPIPWLLPVPGGSGMSGHRQNKIILLKYPEDPEVLSFLGSLSPPNLNKEKGSCR